MKNQSIFVVDDEPDNFDVIETLLADRSYELHYASSGKEAIATLPIISPDLILLDLMMPDMDGIEVCQKIKAMYQWQSVPIIMVTALNSKEDLARCLQAGADDFISKPVSKLELQPRVYSMLIINSQYDRIQSFSKLQKNTIELLTESLDELRGNLASSLPHELNTPLNGILGALGLLIDDIDDMEPVEIHELLDLSYQSAHRLEKFTQRFLNYLFLEITTVLPSEKHDNSKNADGRIPESANSITIENFAKTNAQQNKRLEDLSCQIEEAKLQVSEKHLQWIVHELLENAFKFSQPKTPVTVQGESQEGMFHLKINDRGRGMTNAQIAKAGAFMQFERRTYEQQGIGLGLKIAEKTVESYGGRILITSIYEQETTIHIILPLETATQENA